MIDLHQKKLFLMFYSIIFATHIFKCDAPILDAGIHENAASVVASSKDLFHSLGALLKSISYECKEELHKLQAAFDTYMGNLNQIVPMIDIAVEQRIEGVKIALSNFEEMDVTNCCSANIEYDLYNVPTAVLINVDVSTSVIILCPPTASQLSMKVMHVIENEGKKSKSEIRQTVAINSQLDLENLSIEFDRETKKLTIEIPYKEKHKRAIFVKVK